MTVEQWEILAWLFLITSGMLTVAVMWYQMRIK